MAISDDDGESPGWSAIDAAADRLYQGIKPFHIGTLRPRSAPTL
jgi:hypothetical protein